MPNVLTSLAAAFDHCSVKRGLLELVHIVAKCEAVLM